MYCSRDADHHTRGTLRGENVRVAGKYDAYLARPAPEKSHRDVAILFLSDIMGVWQNSKLLADEFASAGYLTLLVDLFYGDPVPVHKPDDPSFDIQGWLTHGSNGKNPHTEEAVDPIVVDSINVLRGEYGIKRLGAVGYCFGAKVRRQMSWASQCTFQRESYGIQS